MWKAKFALHALDDPWSDLEPVVLGRRPATLSEPDRLVFVEDGERKIRFDIFVNEPEAFVFEDVKVWNDLLIIGYGSKAYCVDLRTRAVNVFAFGYFGSIYTGDAYCLVAADSDLLRIAPDGTLVWRTHLAIDGIIVEKVEGDRIFGQAEHDPPDGWEAFEVALSTGAVLEGREYHESP